MPFAYAPVRGMTDEESTRRAGRSALRAAEIAERLGRPELVSGALDAASSTTIILGRYGDELRWSRSDWHLLDEHRGRLGNG